MARPLLAMIGLLLVAASSCARPRPVDDTQRGDFKTITEADLARASQINLYDYIAAERPRWFRPGTRNSRTFPTTVYLNDTRFGSLETLKSLPFTDVVVVRYFEASAAQQKFPRRDVSAVIQVITR